MCIAGLLADARAVVEIARDEAVNYRNQYRSPVPLKVCNLSFPRRDIFFIANVNDQSYLPIAQTKFMILCVDEARKIWTWQLPMRSQTCKWDVYILYWFYRLFGSYSILVHKKSLWDYLFHTYNMLTDICNCHCDTFDEPWAKYSCFMSWCTVTLIGFRSCLTTTELRNIHTWALYCNVTVWQQSLPKYNECMMKINVISLFILQYLVDRVSSYVHAYTLYSAVRPFGVSIILSSYTPTDGPSMYSIDPSSVSHVSRVWYWCVTFISIIYLLICHTCILHTLWVAREKCVGYNVSRVISIIY